MNGYDICFEAHCVEYRSPEYLFLKPVTEGFVKDGWEKIKELVKKFIAWVKGIIKKIASKFKKTGDSKAHKSRYKDDPTDKEYVIVNVTFDIDDAESFINDAIETMGDGAINEIAEELLDGKIDLSEAKEKFTQLMDKVKKICDDKLADRGTKDVRLKKSDKATIGKLTALIDEEKEAIDDTEEMCRELEKGIIDMQNGVGEGDILKYAEFTTPKILTFLKSVVKYECIALDDYYAMREAINV